MKAKLTVLATLLFLVVSIYPAMAQRRSSTTVVKQNTEKKSNTSDDKQKSVKKKEVSRNVTRTESTAARRTSAAQKQSAPRVKPGNSNSSGRVTPSAEQKVRQQPSNQNRQKSQTVQRKPTNASTAVTRKNTVRSGSVNLGNNNSYNNVTVINKPATPRARAEHNRTVYRVNSRDNRYKPVKNFKGNNNHWTARQAAYHIHHSNRDADFYRHYDHRKYRHWDPVWENYLWNVNSWRDYYSGYHPQSYSFHKHYFYHPAYGHVIKKFNYKPAYFVHNNIRYYNYNGHFFRKFKGVGYVLIDMPYGLSFKKLPAGYERVYVNGFLYFRVGNLFFESNPHGYALIHYPERYFALDGDFYNGGYYRSADFTIPF